MGGETTAGEVLGARLAEQVAELHRRDAEVRDGVEDGVHQLRVTCRRLRGALATFRPVVDREVTDPLRDELRWLARTLGGGRDAEVAHARLRPLVDELPRLAVVGPVRRRLDRTYAERQRVADAHATRILDGARYRRLAVRLDTLVTDPPFTDRAAESASEVLLPRVRRDLKRLRRRIEAVDAAEPADVDAAWHYARKAAKRLRYAAEALEPGWGDDATAFRESAKNVSKQLGERQDTVVARADLRRIGREATEAGESAFTYGVLHEAERERAARLTAQAEDAWQELDRKPLRRWLKP